MNQTLLQIENEHIGFRDDLEQSADEGGEINQAADIALERWFGELMTKTDAKTDAYCGYIRELTLLAAARKEEAERLLMRASIDENIVKRLKDRLKDFMERNGLKKVGNIRKASVCANGGRAPIDVTCSVYDLPTALQRVTVAANVDAIREALERGETVQWCAIAARGSHLRIS